MELTVSEVFSILANVGVVTGIVFLIVEIRQNNRYLAAQARYSLRQYRADVLDTMLLPHVLEATHKWGRGDALTDVERSTGSLLAIKAIEVWEWQYGEYAAGMLQRRELPVAAWRLWFHGKGPPFPVPVRHIYEQRKPVLNPDFVRFFDENVVANSPD